MKEPIIIFGKSGQLGSALASLAPNWSEKFDLQIYGRPEGDLTNPAQIKSLIEEKSPALVINASAYTAVDQAEEDEENAFELNAIALYKLATECKLKNIPLIHISTDYVFDGTKETPYAPEDPISPQNAYGRSKLAGEWACQAAHPDGAYIVRTSWVFSEWGNNFVKTMLKLSEDRDELAIVHDQVGSPTYATDLACCALQMADRILNPESSTTPGIYHYSNSGTCSWFEFASEILRDKNIKINKTTSDKFPRPAKRPQFSKLNTSKIETEFNLDIRSWQDALAECLHQIKNQ